MTLALPSPGPLHTLIMGCAMSAEERAFVVAVGGRGGGPRRAAGRGRGKGKGKGRGKGKNF